MKQAAKFFPVVVLLTAALSVLAQERSLATEAKPGSKKMMAIDPKAHEEMMTTAKEMGSQLQELKNRLDQERSAAGDSGGVTPAERAALDSQIQTLEKSIQQLRQQLETRPQYLDQTNNPLRP